jgi:hypothetical protein
MTPSLKPLIKLEVDVAPPVVVDPGRRMIPILGGRVSGSYTGKVIPGGADWQFIAADGRLDLEARYVISLDSHGEVEVTSLGVRHGPPDILAKLGRGEAVDPSLYYFRTSMRFRTAAPGLARLNALLCLAVGERKASVVHLDVFEVG